MATYYFDIRINGQLMPDEEGSELADLDEVRREAAKSLCEISDDYFGKGLSPVAMTITARDDAAGR